MAFYLAGLVTLLATLVWGCTGFYLHELPARLLEWATALPWGRDPWWIRALALAVAPLVVMIVFFLILIALVIVAGRPASVLRNHGVEGEKFFWQRRFHSMAWVLGETKTRTFWVVAVFAFVGCLLSAVACVVTLIPSLFGWRDKTLPWTGEPAVPVCLFLVWMGMVAAVRQCRKACILWYGLSKSSGDGSLATDRAMDARNAGAKIEEIVVAAVDEPLDSAKGAEK